MYPEIGNKLIGLIDRVAQASCLLVRQFTGWKPVLLLLFALPLSKAAKSEIDFNRDVRPILSDKCYQCHGPDADNQESEFRLDSREAAIADLGDYFGVVPGSLEESDLHWRIWEDIEEDLMPPVDSKLALTDEEKKTLDRWIEAGAPYDEHWSFKPINRADSPLISKSNADWSANGIDRFIAARLEREGLAPSPEAEKASLIRRVTLDLTGLPPTIEEVDAFLADSGLGAWERVVDRLLASPRYGERMGLVWLDAARYADSGGYQNDIRRSQWPWRDWVIRAYNDNMPFDQFTVEQLAGDLLPDHTRDQRLATAFNRNHRINNEGGIIAEEYLVEYVADRVETTSTVFLGLTMGCARCHDHKYDPIKQKDFYEMFAFFNNIPENGRDGTLAPRPNMAVYQGGTYEEHERLKGALKSTTGGIRSLPKRSEDRFFAWIDQETKERRHELDALKAAPRANLHLPFDVVEETKTFDARNAKRKVTLRSRNNEVFVRVTNAKYGGALRYGVSTMVRVDKPHGEAFDSRQPRSWLVNVQTPKAFAGSEGPVLAIVESGSQQGYRLMLEEVGDRQFFRMSFQLIDNLGEKRGIEVASEAVVAKGAWARLGVTWDGSGRASGVRLYLDGHAVESVIERDALDSPIKTAEALIVGARAQQDALDMQRDATFRNGLIDDVQIYDETLSPDRIETLSKADPQNLLFASLDETARSSLQSAWIKTDPEGIRLSKALAKQKAELNAFEKNHVAEVSIMEEMDTPRETYLLTRGAYDQPDKSERLEPSTMDALPQMNSSLPRNRLGLAQWIVDPKNPLTARVAVNRYWQMYFGIGLVKTPEDFGSQGEVPSHPELLDFLAASFIDSDWNVKAMQKQIVMSATYRQSSRVTSVLLEKDPDNRLLARGPRFRLYGQALRDQALAVSGLLADEQGGPPVMPYQPEGLWDEVSAKGYKYIVGKGDDLYRRSLYTFWRRTVPPPSMMNFDNSAREMCSVRLNTTNTPLQALNLMNDPQFVEAARALGERMLREGGESSSERIEFGHRLVLARSPERETLRILESGYNDYLSTFRTQPERANSLVATGASKAHPNLSSPELAAMTMVASTLLNLDETVTKE